MKEPRLDEKGCHNCNHHNMNHKVCDITTICHRGSEWEAIPEPISNNKESKADTHKCKICGGRTALVTGYFVYEPDDEPYMNGVYEKSLIEPGECWTGGYVCDDCKNVQDLWHE